MKASFLIGILLICQHPALRGQTGDASGTRTALAQAAESNSPQALTAYAEFLDRYGDPDARRVYARLAAARKSAGDSTGAALASRRLTMLDLLAGDREAAKRNAAAAGN
jgi:hypothetical protein